jgi:hypothetical protein
MFLNLNQVKNNKMAIADNASYKDQYFFKMGDQYDSSFGENPSLNIESDINYSIKSNPYRANVEIEGREVVLNPNLDGIFNAKGKRHHQGGMPVQLEAGSFVFSDDRSLSLNKQEQEVLELKQGNSSNKKNNTPAEVLKRNVDLEHYNTLINNLNDPKKNMLAKSSSELMLKKYKEVIGKIAFAQESKKGFPDDVPEFAKDSAPVYNDELKSEIMAQKQYAKYGGYINNPYKNKKEADLLLEMQTGGGITPYTGDQTGTNPGWNKSKYNEKEWNQFAADIGFYKEANEKGIPITNESFQNWLSQHPTYGPIVKKVHEGSTNQTGKWFVGGDGYVYQQFGENRAKKIADGMVGVRWDQIKELIQIPTDKIPSVDQTTTLPPLFIEPPQIKNIEVKPQDFYPIKWQFTPWQKASQAINLARAVDIVKYPGLRSQYLPKYVSLPLYNPEPAIRDAQATTAMAVAGANILNPILRNSVASDIVGRNLDQVNKIRAQYDNMNVGQKTTEEMTNTQLRNQSLMTNINLDQDYYKNMVISSANKDKARQFAKDQFWSGVFKDVATNESLAYMQATQRDPAWTYDFRTGDYKRLPKSILDVMASNSKSSYLDPYVKSINYNALSDRDKIQFLKVLMMKDFQPQPSFSSGTTGKKGGMIKKNPYR